MLAIRKYYNFVELGTVFALSLSLSLSLSLINLAFPEISKKKFALVPIYWQGGYHPWTSPELTDSMLSREIRC